MAWALWPSRCFWTCLLFVSVLTSQKVVARKSERTDPGAQQQLRAAFVTITTDDYYAHGAFVALHSIALHLGSSRNKHKTERVLMVSGPGISSTWRQRFIDLGVRIVDVQEVVPSKAIRAAMEADRTALAGDGILDVVQPVPYGGAFAKVHAWDPDIFGAYDKVILMDGDVLIKRNIEGLLDLEPLAAGRDMMDDFNYGVLVLRPDGVIHSKLLRLLEKGTETELAQYNTRSTGQTGFCDQTIVTAYLALHHGPIHFFEDLRAVSRANHSSWVLSTEYNFVVSYRTNERCEDPLERKRVEKARVVHFANNWLNFRALASNRTCPGRIDSPRCYQGAFHYWHDVYWHAMGIINASRHGAESAHKNDAASAAPLTKPPVYKAADKLALPEEVLEVFNDFQDQQLKARRARSEL